MRSGENQRTLLIIPVLEALLAQFPFIITAFHADNGAEYINHRVAKPLIELTKLRTRHSNDKVKTGLSLTSI